MSSTPLPQAAGSVTDSIFTWTFRATSGDSWGGTLVEDSSRYVVGSTLATAHGTYSIVAADAQPIDLGALGLEEGWIAIGWYRDATGAWLVTQRGEASAAGSAGLGSEQDWAWDGQGWDGFGLGGADQANPGALADSLFGWTFRADSGDILYGTLLADSVDWNPGDTLRTAHGTYRIDSETPFGQAQGETGLEGTVRTTRYTDGAARIDFTLESGGAAPTGQAGLGSELDRAWNGSEWVQVGQGGALQADRLPDMLMDWSFQAGNGDRYLGRLVGHDTAWSVGDTVATAGGTYTITGKASLGGQVIADGTVWTTGGYHDSSAQQWLTSYSGFVLGGAPSGYGGLGSELDYAWDGDEWDDYGRAGALLASVEQPALFAWYFQHRASGDLYVGFTVEDAGRWTTGDTLAGARGTYTIYDEKPWRLGDAPEGTVWVTDYLDGPTQTWLKPRAWANGGQWVTQAGLGQEYDYAWDGVEWDDFGQGGIYQLDLGPDGFYAWAFYSDSGDLYAGWLSEDFARFEVGDRLQGAFGYYEIYAKWDHPNPTNIRDGTLWITDYYDGNSDRWLPTRSWGQNGQSASEWGIGNEYEYAWTGTEWLGFGVGGIHEIDVPRLAANNPPEPFIL
ncbi:hypothetical protein [Falsiroseomonas selenitidurans]|uniref:Uncharacterized protein n=1 Tax=Falsiroseomonas selenitidurans TaxID=2716335 RepID=A0ABX1E675_9PROT|nr:hypothetical protein [Falsiroseomonas selenitidurans]NKC32689.1 hypothetical protein [Falsiroseomonas selenitidurans]